MKRINKEVKKNEVRYTYEVANKMEVRRLVFNRERIFKNSIGAFGGFSNAMGHYYVTIQYAR